MKPRFLDLGVIGQTPLTQIPSTMEFDGALANPAGLVAALNATIQSDPGAASSSYATTSGTTLTLTPPPGFYQWLSAGSAVTVTIDYAYNIVNNLQYPFLGYAYSFVVGTAASTTVATPTLSDTAVTLAGTTSIAASTARWYQLQVTQLSTTVGSQLTAGTTWTSLTQVGSTNAYTVALGTNAISPTVGNAIYIGTTAGTLPAGWYPIAKVTSATSFVIVAPKAGTAWTCTAATLPGTTTVPSSAYTPGLPGLYSPLVTIQGILGIATATA